MQAWCMCFDMIDRKLSWLNDNFSIKKIDVGTDVKSMIFLNIAAFITHIHL